MKQKSSELLFPLAFLVHPISSLFWIIKLKALWNEELSTFCLMCKTNITVGTLENTLIFSICLYCLWWRRRILALDFCENFHKDEQRNTSVNWQHVIPFLRDFRFSWAMEERRKSHTCCQFAHGNAKLHGKVRHGQDELLRYMLSWHFGKWLKYICTRDTGVEHLSQLSDNSPATAAQARSWSRLSGRQWGGMVWGLEGWPGDWKCGLGFTTGARLLSLSQPMAQVTANLPHSTAEKICPLSKSRSDMAMAAHTLV